MPDRERVIKGLEMHKKRDCAECPYRDVILRADNWCISGIHNDCLALLKEQEAKPPRKITKIGGLMNGICPNILCNAEINSISNGVACGYCGQAVKWNDT